MPMTVVIDGTSGSVVVDRAYMRPQWVACARRGSVMGLLGWVAREPYLRVVAVWHVLLSRQFISGTS